MRSIPVLFVVLLGAVALGAQLPAVEGRPAAPERVLIRDVAVLPMTGAGRLEARDVRLRDGLIASIDAAGERPAEPGELVIDGAGCTLLPGLFDTHVHFETEDPDEHLALYLAHGVTTVQSMHGTPRILELRERVASGELLGPRIVTAGPTTATERVNSPERAREVVAAQKAAGYDAIKMYGDGNDSMTPETYAALIDAAHAAGLRVVGHAPRNMYFDTVLANGQDSIDHMEEFVYTVEPLLDRILPLVRYQFQGGEFEDVERTLAEFDTLGLEDLAADLAQQVLTAGLAVTPTLVCFSTIVDLKASRLDALVNHPQLRYASPLATRAWAPERNHYRRSGPERLERMGRVLGAELELQRMLVRAFHAAGVPLMTGSDTPLTYVFPGWSLQREIHLLADAGLGAEAALRAATIVPARELGLDDRLGSVEPGKQAELLLVRGDPLADLDALARVAGVFTHGAWLSADALQTRLDALAAQHAALGAQLAPLYTALDADDAPAALAVLADMESPPPSLAAWLEDVLNARGYDALRAGRTEQAVELFARISEAFPESWNAWDSLGEGLATSGDNARAIRCYQRSLELNPGNAGGRAALERLSAAQATSSALLDDGAGSWAGWWYGTHGGDEPLRLNIEPGNSPVATLDEPIADRWGTPLELRADAHADDATFVLRPTQGDLAMSLHLTRQGERLVGWTERDGEREGRMEFERSPELLGALADGEALASQGVYRGPDGELLQLAAWPWNLDELWALGLTDGRSGTLFATRERDRFVLGSVFGAPRAPVATLALQRDTEGRVTGLRRREAEGATAEFERLPFRIEPVGFESDGARLEGELVLPPGEGPFPAVVVLGGGGWWTRLDTRLWGDRFAALGVAALCFDKRGRGASGGERTNTFDVIADDAVAALETLRARDDIADDQVGFFGFSRGGWHAPLAASRSEHAAFVVAASAPAVSPKEQETTRRLAALRARGVRDEAELERARAYLEHYWRVATAAATTDEGWAEYVALRDALPAEWRRALGVHDSPDPQEHAWTRLNSLYDPLPAITRLACPVLVLLGEADTNVTPAINLPAWVNALSAAPTDDFSVRVLSGADHAMFLAGTGSEPTPLHAMPGMAPDLAKLLGGWLRERLPALR